MSDLISRQAAIDVINHELRCGAVIDQCGLETAHDLIEELPSAQPPEIIRCKDCYHYPSEYADCPMVGWFRNEHDFCSRAERRQDEVNSRNKKS